MSEEIGPRLPPPLQFELGTLEDDASPAQALLLITVDADGMPRLAVMSRAELSAPDRAHLMVAASAASRTCENLRRSGQAAIWCVLDAAAYTIRAAAQESQSAKDPALRTFELTITSVLRDFQAQAPMTAGPTYRRMGLT
ncbi:MAG: hypothetical protein DLM53_04955 [Candidatus Eremiobacter antarcticus]|nr:hypothetical protein [Candidatus Eremiobacteraeota bacterium]MBC5807867.1 hypothetical protein [Candidatus Eremiobacteraeota bacterium]PZR62762.1 MAG: hypothetical protein DLM53_04955 [Candidatus Eremiobacter sp. RRmetagenome_bin22]